MPQVSLPPDPTRTNISLDVVGDALPVRLVSDPPGAPTPPSVRLWRAWSLVWRDMPTRWFLIFAFVVFIALAVVLAVSFYFSLTMITPERISSSRLGYAVEYPPRPVVREDEQFSITLVNRSPISLTHVSATLVFSDVLPITSDTTLAQFESLAPGERKTRVIHFTLNKYVAPMVQAELRADADQFETVLLDTYRLDIAPFPWVKTVGRWLVGVLSTTLSGVLLWTLRGAFTGVLPGK